MSSCVIHGFIDLSHFMVSIVSFLVGLQLLSFCIYQLPVSWLQQYSFVVTEEHGVLLGGKRLCRDEVCQVPHSCRLLCQWHGVGEGEETGQKI